MFLSQAQHNSRPSPVSYPEFTGDASQCNVLEIEKININQFFTFFCLRTHFVYLTLSSNVVHASAPYAHKKIKCAVYLPKLINMTLRFNNEMTMTILLFRISIQLYVFAYIFLYFLTYFVFKNKR